MSSPPKDESREPSSESATTSAITPRASSSASVQRFAKYAGNAHVRVALDGEHKHVHGPDCKHDHDEHKHVHGPDCRHDHDEHEHVHGPDCKHDHGEHTHVHGPDCKHDHDHGHDRGHDHAHAERPPGHRPAEDGGPALQLDLAGVLPGESNEQGRFERFEEMLRAHRGVRDAHIRRDQGHVELCIHYDDQHVPAAELLRLARATGVLAAKRYLSKAWFVRGMESAQCAMVLEYSLARMPGILEATVAYASERLMVELDAEITSERKIEERIEALGYVLETPQHGHACSHHAHGGGLAPKLEMPLSLAGGVLTGLGWGLAQMGTLPAFVPTLCYAAAIASGGYFACRGAVASLRQLRVDIESSMVIAALAAAALGAWFEGAFLLFLFSLGHGIEHRAMDRARRAVEALSKTRPKVAQRKRASGVEEVPVEALARGDRIVIRPGDRVPIDGVIREGESSLEQAALTGESTPVEKRVGDEVYCGSINGHGALSVEVTRLASETMLAKMVDLVVEAEARQGPSQRVARKIEQRVVPWVLGGALVLPVVLLALGLSLQESLLRTVALLVAASPCALAISTPAAVLSAVAAAARNGVLVKGGAYLEALAHVDAIAFDKTGTLTEGKPRLVKVMPLSGVREEELLATAAALEAMSSHPLARAVLEATRARGVSFANAEACEAVPGRGIRGSIATRPVALGSLALFEAASVDATLRELVVALEEAGQTTIVVQHDGRFLGVLGVADTPREAAPRVLSALKRLGVLKTWLLSGDNERVARAVAAQVGVDEVHAPLLPAGKVEVLRKLTRNRKGVAMVGDGVNDGPALAAASVGVAMGGVGSDVALETADVVLMGDDLSKLPFALELSRKAVTIIRQNLFISLGVAGVLSLCSLFGIAGVSQSVIFHEGSTLFVVANGLRLLRVSPRPR